MNDCSQCVVKNRAICAALTDEERGALNKIGRVIDVHGGHTLMWEGDDSSIVANVIEGVFKLSTATADGREQIVGVVYASDFIGRPFGPTTPHNVTALTDGRICLFTRNAFDSFAREHPELEHKLLQKTLTELDRARQWMLLLGRKSAGERVASLLLDLAQRASDGGGCNAVQEQEIRFTLPFGRQMMADLLGLTIETVSRQLTILRQDRVIDLPERRAVLVRDRAALEAAAGTG